VARQLAIDTHAGLPISRLRGRPKHTRPSIGGRSPRRHAVASRSGPGCFGCKTSINRAVWSAWSRGCAVCWPGSRVLAAWGSRDVAGVAGAAGVGPGLGWPSWHGAGRGSFRHIVVSGIARNHLGGQNFRVVGGTDGGGIVHSLGRPPTAREGENQAVIGTCGHTHNLPASRYYSSSPSVTPSSSASSHKEPQYLNSSVDRAIFMRLAHVTSRCTGALLAGGWSLTLGVLHGLACRRPARHGEGRAAIASASNSASISGATSLVGSGARRPLPARTPGDTQLQGPASRRHAMPTRPSSPTKVHLTRRRPVAVLISTSARRPRRRGGTPHPE